MKKIAFALALTAALATSATSSAFAADATETLPSGVTITQLTAGSGASPSATDVVTVNYRGTLKDGTEFDSSYKRGQPSSFPLNRVIPCWTQGMQKMKIGEKARLVCPSATAYGSRAIGPIPPNSDLTFEVELLKIQQQ